MHKIFSQCEPGKSLHIVKRNADVIRGRENLCDDGEALQAATIYIREGRRHLRNGKRYPAHSHNIKPGTEAPTAESWVIISGAVMATLYDVDDQELTRVKLGPGDCLVSLSGGHAYEILADDTFVYEFKTGPYGGRDADKTLIETSQDDSDL